MSANHDVFRRDRDVFGGGRVQTAASSVGAAFRRPINVVKRRERYGAISPNAMMLDPAAAAMYWRLSKT